MLELPALYSTIIGGLIVAVITGISGLAWSLLKKRAAIRKWKEKEEVKGESELGADLDFGDASPCSHVRLLI